jgi:DNA-binding MarR family transcriptional regulator
VDDRTWVATALVDDLAVALRRHHHEMARRLGLREVELACLQIVDRPRGMPMTALAERLGLSPGAATAVVDGLEGAGRVARWRDPGNRRKVVVGHLVAPRDHLSWQALLDDVQARQAPFSDEELLVVARWVAAMSGELHRRAGDLTVARAGREALERRRRAGRP